MKRIWQIIDAFVVALTVAVVMMLFVVATASAHADLAESEPRNGEQLTTSPERVTTTFTQELEMESSMVVLDGNGRQIDNDDGGVDLYDPDHKSMVVTLPSSLPDGQYSVEWIAISLEDGDTTNGAFVFGIGVDSLMTNSIASSAVVDSASSVGRWVIGGVAALIVGLLVMMWVLTRQSTVKLR